MWVGGNGGWGTDAADDFVVGVHFAADAVGLGVADLRERRYRLTRAGGVAGRVSGAHLNLEGVLRHAVDLVEALGA